MEKRPNDTIDTLRAEFANVRKTAIVGHIRPDGDCISSCLALYHYLKDNYGYEADVYLQPYPSVFDMLPDTAVIRHTVKPEVYDVVYSIDCADADRIGAGKELFDSAKKRVIIISVILFLVMLIMQRVRSVPHVRCSIRSSRKIRLIITWQCVYIQEWFTILACSNIPMLHQIH